MEPRRATPLLVVDDMEERLRLLLALGFERIDLGTGLVSLRAGNSFVILATPAALARFHPDTIALLKERPAILLHVASVADLLKGLPPEADIVEMVARTPCEAVVRLGGEVLVITDRQPGPRWQEDAVPRRLH